MIEFKTYHQRSRFCCVASGWGKEFRAEGHGGQLELNRIQHFLAKRLVIATVKGFIQNREIAYQAKNYNEPSKMRALHALRFHLAGAENKNAATIYRLIYLHQDKIRTLLPSKLSNTHYTIEELITFCKNNYEAISAN